MKKLNNAPKNLFLEDGAMNQTLSAQPDLSEAAKLIHHPDHVTNLKKLWNNVATSLGLEPKKKRGTISGQPIDLYSHNGTRTEPIGNPQVDPNDVY